MSSDPVEVLLKFAFIAVLYLFLLWVVRSALRDLGRPTAEVVNESEPYEETPAGLVPGHLVVERGGGLQPGSSFELYPGLTIGRSPESGIRIDDSFASSRHARIDGRSSALYIEDMSSTNGTYVNGRRLTVQELLRPNDRIRIGDTEFRYDP